MMPHQGMSRITAKGLPKNDERILVSVRLIIHRGELHGDLRGVHQRPCLLDFLYRLMELARIAGPNPIALLQQSFGYEIPGATPKPIAPLSPTAFEPAFFPGRRYRVLGASFDLPAHPSLTR
jgi:hypothetical protein